MISYSIQIKIKSRIAISKRFSQFLKHTITSDRAKIHLAPSEYAACIVLPRKSLSDHTFTVIVPTGNTPINDQKSQYPWRVGSMTGHTGSVNINVHESFPKLWICSTGHLPVSAMRKPPRAVAAVAKTSTLIGGGMRVITCSPREVSTSYGDHWVATRNPLP
jgi:hypothetical protein